MVDVELRVVPCDYRIVGNRYFATIHLLVEHNPLVVHAFWRHSDCVENSILMDELGIKYSYTNVEFPLNDFSFFDKFKELSDYICV